MFSIVFLHGRLSWNFHEYNFPGSPVVKNSPANAGTRIQSLVQEDPTRHGATKPAHHNYRARALEPESHSHWRPCARSPCSAKEMLPQLAGPALQLEGSPCSPN